MILIMFLVLIWVGRLFDEVKRLKGLKHMLSLLSSDVSRENFPKHSECFGRILVAKIWRSTRLLKTHALIIDKVQLYYHRLCARHRLCSFLFHAIFQPKTACKYYINDRMITITFRNISECFAKIRTIILR